MFGNATMSGIITTIFSALFWSHHTTCVRVRASQPVTPKGGGIRGHACPQEDAIRTPLRPSSNMITTACLTRTYTPAHTPVHAHIHTYLPVRTHTHKQNNAVIIKANRSTCHYSRRTQPVAVPQLWVTSLTMGSQLNTKHSHMLHWVETLITILRSLIVRLICRCALINKLHSTSNWSQ